MSKKVIWTERDKFMKSGIDRISEADVLLDIGCGIRPHDYITPYIYICCEPYDEYVEVLREKVEKDSNNLFVILNYDWEKVVREFGEKSVDTVFLLDVIEHLDKQTGERLLRMTEKIVRKQIVIFTPLGFVEQHTLPDGRDAWGLNGAEWQEHKSGWLPEDFDDTWEIVVCKDFHQYNNIGEKLDHPFGALWAIKNNNTSEDLPLKVLGNSSDFTQILFEDGKRVLRLLKQDKANLEQNKANLEQEKANLEQDKANLEQDKANLEQEKANLEQEKANLEQENENLKKRYNVLENIRNKFSK